MTNSFSRDTAPFHRGADAALLFGIALAICTLGILTRPTGYFAGFWPANATILAILVRFPAISRPASWASACFGFLTADLLAGNPLTEAMALTLANFAGIAAGHLLLSRFARDIRQMARGTSIAALLGAALLASAATAVFGAEVSVRFHGRIYSEALMLWFSSELMNYVTLMPIILSLPENLKAHMARVRIKFSRHGWDSTCGSRLFAAVLLLIFSYIGQMLGGPGALLFPLPALILTAMVFSISTTSIIVLCYALWCHAALVLNMVDTNIPLATAQDTMSMRFGVTLLSLAPLTVASMNVARQALVLALDQAATRDALTGILNRRAFMERASALCGGTKGRVAVLMLDIDHFKTINDAHGHALGDEALKAFASAVALRLGKDDVFGRLGGEEFGIAARIETAEDAALLGERLLEAVRQTDVRLAGGNALGMTVSIGAVTRDVPLNFRFDDALRLADEALYEAKRLGRNRAEIRLA
ncbi:GGDEF domain-containing protein [Pararhizobium sp.]|uniref:GGDEF domain-containing protein n=1 Tax=Pararhizobium sp. TaxID=1977563 RepID=UPI002720D092|nr:diguanylate cyclase [Pararhizobium sp.]MDO9416447.1 diguanylate cyclase [Pararhizobium sp.]